MDWERRAESTVAPLGGRNQTQDEIYVNTVPESFRDSPRASGVNKFRESSEIPRDRAGEQESEAQKEAEKAGRGKRGQ